MADTTEEKFEIAIPEEDLDLLKRKLASTRLPDELENAGWDYGAPLSHLKRLLEYWKNE